MDETAFERRLREEGLIGYDELLADPVTVLDFVYTSGKSVMVKRDGEDFVAIGRASEGNDFTTVTATPAEADLFEALAAHRLGVPDRVISAGSALRGMAVAMGHEPGLHCGE